MTDVDRQHLAAILGMLGSEHAGERAAAGLQAEAFRKKHGMTWQEMIQGKTVYLGGTPPWTPPSPSPEPSAMPEPSAATYRWNTARVFAITWMGLVLGVILIVLKGVISAP